MPQAAVWIRTRDFKLVEALDGKAQALLSVANGVTPGTWEASRALFAPLKSGRLTAWGQRPEIQSVELIPQTFWKSGGTIFDRLMDDGQDEGVVASADGQLWSRLVVDADDCMTNWPSLRNILEGGPVPLNVALHSQVEQPEAWPQWLLTRPDVVVTGLSDSRARAPIDRGVFSTGSSLDLIANSVTTVDGIHWSSVMVELVVPIADADFSEQRSATGVEASQLPTKSDLAQIPQGETPVYTRPTVYSKDLVPEQFTRWADELHRAGKLITEGMALDAMQGPKAGDGGRSGGRLAAGKGLSRTTIRAWLNTLADDRRAVRGSPPSRSSSR